MMSHRLIKQWSTFTVLCLVLGMVLVLAPRTVRAKQILDVRAGGQSTNCPPECWEVTINSALEKVVDNPSDPDVIRIYRSIDPNDAEPLVYREQPVITKSVIIEAGEPGITLDGDGFRPLLIDGRNRTAPLNVTIRGLKLINGDATSAEPIFPDDPSYRAGGGLAIIEANALIENSVISGNMASQFTDTSGFGGGIYIQGGAPVLRNNIIERNTASVDARNYVGFGGGIAIFNSAARLEGNIIRRNVAVRDTTQAGFAAGGGIYIQSEPGGPAPVLIGNLIENNAAGGATARGEGGGIYLQGSAAAILNNTIADNIAGSAGDNFGGGLFVRNAAPLIHGNTIADNIAGTDTARRGHGGGIALAASGGMIEQNTLVGNRGGGAEQGIGGGLYINTNPAAGAAPTLTANYVLQNSAQYDGGIGQGGGLYVFAATPTLTNNVFAQNRDSEGAGGLLVDGGAISLLHNTIADNNSSRAGVTTTAVWLRSGALMNAANNIIASRGYGVYLTGAITRATLTHTLFHGTDTARRVAGNGIIANEQALAGEPRFVSTSPTTPDYHIRPDSAAREAAQSSNLATDIDGRRRPLGTPDIGADEYALHTFMPLIAR